MRKTCPIVLPEQNLPKDMSSPHAITRTTSAVSSSSSPLRSHGLLTDFNANSAGGNFGSDNYNYTEFRTPTQASTNNYMTIMHSDDNDDDVHENNEFPSTLNGLGEQCDAINHDGHNQLPELSSLNSEFLNTILSATPNYRKSSNSNQSNNTSVNHTSMHPETNFIQNSNTNSNSNESNGIDSAATAVITSTTCDGSRPRQLGRRSEMRSRIVSITAERIAEGNPVSVFFYS